MTAAHNSLKDKILVALDVSTLEQALYLVDLLKDAVGGFKVGLELCTSAGTQQAIEAVSRAGSKVFVDLKFKDIPNTVAGAAKAVTRPGVFMFNVHCDGGSAMMQAAVATARASSEHPPLVIGVTLLTSIDEPTLQQELRIPEDAHNYVLHLARLAQSAGLDGVVCSAHEVAAIKAICGQQFLTVVPGVRPTWAVAGDQKRVMTPADAIRAGADYLVIGRPITHPPVAIGTPAIAAQRIMQEIADALTGPHYA
jgi:orotidine-5'-phosphate decarboxylase